MVNEMNGKSEKENQRMRSQRLYYDFLTEDDLVCIEKWWNDGNVTAPMGFPDGLHVTIQQLKQRFQKEFAAVGQPTEQRTLIIYEKKSNKPIGELAYGEYNKVEKSCRLAIKIGETSCQGRGYGKEALQWFMEFLHKEYGITTILIDSIHDNAAAVHLYEKLGFAETERIPDYWTDETGKAHDIIFYEKSV